MGTGGFTRAGVAHNCSASIPCQGIRCRAVADTLPAYAQPEEPTLEDAYLYLISREAAQKTIRLFPMELRRLLQSRLTWIFILLTVISPLAGLILYKPATASTMLSIYLANPALAGGVVGGILFGLLTICELDRANRNRVNVLVDATVSPLSMAMVRLLSIITVALLALGITMVMWLPVSRRIIGAVFDGTDYVFAYILFMGFTLPLAVLIAASAYQFTQRMDLSLVLFAAFVG